MTIPLLTALLFLLAACNPPATSGDPAGPPNGDGNATAPKRVTTGAGEEITFFPAYGYRKGTDWKMHLRAWVHEDRTWAGPMITALGMGTCEKDELPTFLFRTNDFLDDDKALESVVIEFDSDPDRKRYAFDASMADGITALELTLPDETARKLLAAQKSAEWLTYRAVSNDHEGLGRVRLIEPQGLSLISDIDDTIKVTNVPAGKATVVRNTFCRDFTHVTDMEARYKAFGKLPVHYVSGGPEQMYGYLYDYLITGNGEFPEGTFHLAFYPKNLLSPETLNNIELLLNRALQLTAETSLNTTFEHKVRTISRILDHFPEQQFILAGDSGEVDPEVYRAIKQARPDQVERILIRDLVNDNRDNPYRLKDMEIIEVDPAICMADQHREKLSAFLKDVYRDQVYKKEAACTP